MADTIGTYGDTTVVTGPDGNPAWQLESEFPIFFGGGVYVTITGTLTPDLLTQLSVDYVMVGGTFGNFAPGFSLIDTTNNVKNEAYVYWGTPQAGGTFSDPNSGNTTYANTGNYADTGSSDLRVVANGFGGDNSDTEETWQQFLNADGDVAIGFISIYLTGGTSINTSILDTANFQVNNTVYTPSGTSQVPEPRSLVLIGCLLAAMGTCRILNSNGDKKESRASSGRRRAETEKREGGKKD